MLQVPNLVKSDLVFNERLTEFSVDIYTNIKKGNFDNITGIMIADKYHPILENNEVIKVLKESTCVNITYEKYHYKYPLNLV